MAARTIALLLLGFALHTSHSSPVPQCGVPPPPPPPCGVLPPPPPPPPCAAAPPLPEVYSQNGGSPLILSVPGSASLGSISSGLLPGPSSLPGLPPPPPPPPAPCAPLPLPLPAPAPAPCAPLPLPLPLPAPAPAPCAPLPLPLPAPAPAPCAPLPPPPPPPCSGPLPPPPPCFGPLPISAPGAPLGLAPPVPGVPLPPGEANDIAQAQALADQSIAENAVLEAPQSNQPCKVETNSEVIQSPGETFVHQPGEILISQPPTRLVINHAPYIVRPSPIILNQGGKTVTNSYTRRIMPGQIQYRPVIVRIVKPIEKKVFIDHASAGAPGSQSFVSQPPAPNACVIALAQNGQLPPGYPVPPGLGLPPSALPPPALGLPPSASGLPPPALGLPPSALGALSSSALSPSALTAADQASLAALLSQANLSAPSGPDAPVVLPAIPAPGCGAPPPPPPPPPGCGC